MYKHKYTFVCIHTYMDTYVSHIISDMFRGDSIWDILLEKCRVK